jgi:hypothetical protein
MASKRHKRRRSCTYKIRYPTFDEARRAAHDLLQATRRHCSVYGCKFCGGYHIGRQPTYVKRIVATRQQRNAACASFHEGHDTLGSPIKT